MNKTIMSIRNQINPDKRVVDDLLEQIENGRAEEVKIGGAKRFAAVASIAAVLALVCIVGANSLDSKLTSDKSETTTVPAVQSVRDSSSKSEEVIEGDWTVELDYYDYTNNVNCPENDDLNRATEDEIILQNQTVTYDGKEYTLVGGVETTYKTDSLEQYIGGGTASCSYKTKFNMLVGMASFASPNEQILVGFGDGRYYLYKNPDYKITELDTRIDYAEVLSETEKSDKDITRELGFSEETLSAVKNDFIDKSGTMDFDGGLYRYSQEIDRDSYDIGEKVGTTELEAYVDFGERIYLNMWIYTIADSDSLAVHLEDDTWWLFENITENNWSIVLSPCDETDVVGNIEAMTEDEAFEIYDYNPYIYFGGRIYKYSSIDESVEADKIVAKGSTMNGYEVVAYKKSGMPIEKTLIIYMNAGSGGVWIEYWYYKDGDTVSDDSCDSGEVSETGVYEIDKIYTSADENSRPDDAREISANEKRYIASEAPQITVEGKTYSLSSVSGNFPSDSVLIAEGSLTLTDGTVYRVYIYDIGDGKIGVDVGDSDLMVYE